MRILTAFLHMVRPAWIITIISAALPLVVTPKSFSSELRCPAPGSIRSLCYGTDVDLQLGKPMPYCPECREYIANCFDGLMKKGQLATAETLVQWEKQVSLRRKNHDKTEFLTPKKIEALALAKIKQQYEYHMLAEDDHGGRELQEITLMMIQSCARFDVPVSNLAKFVCRVRFNQDLWRFKVLERWPGCTCPGGGRLIGGVCMHGLSPDSPIDERVPVAMGRMAEAMRKWAAANGLTVREMRYAGCTNDRLAREDRDCEDCKEDNLTLKRVSPHGEARACDLDSVVFEDIQAKRQTMFTLKDRKGFTPALQRFLSLEENRSDSQLVFGAKQNARGFPTGVPNFQRIWDKVETGPKPAAFSESEWFQLRAGMALQRSAIQAGFYLVEPFSDRNHEDHFHLSVPMTRRDWEVMGRENAPLAEKIRTTHRALCAKLKLDPQEVEICR